MLKVSVLSTMFRSTYRSFDPRKIRPVDLSEIFVAFSIIFRLNIWYIKKSISFNLILTLLIINKQTVYKTVYVLDLYRETENVTDNRIKPFDLKV